MSFKYINPGYASLLDAEGGITAAVTAKSKTGVAFYQPDKTQGIDIAAIPKEFYCKFDFYIGDVPSDKTFEMRIFSPDSSKYHGVHIDKDSSDLELQVYVNGSRVYYKYYAWSNPSLIKQNFNINPKSINTVWFYARNRTDDSKNDGLFSLYINGKEIVKYENQAMYAGSLYPIVIYANKEYSLISNLIISDTEIDKKEQVVILPIKNTETDMTAKKDGIYSANAAGQKILQSVDIASLVEDYGADSEIKGIAVIGNPAYRTAEGLSQLTALEQYGGTLKEYGTKEAKTDTAAGVVDGHAVSMKLTDLAGYKFGWKAGAV